MIQYPKGTRTGISGKLISVENCESSKKLIICKDPFFWRKDGQYVHVITIQKFYKTKRKRLEEHLANSIPGDLPSISYYHPGKVSLYIKPTPEELHKSYEHIRKYYRNSSPASWVIGSVQVSLASSRNTTIEKVPLRQAEMKRIILHYQGLRDWALESIQITKAYLQPLIDHFEKELKSLVHKKNNSKLESKVLYLDGQIRALHLIEDYILKELIEYQDFENSAVPQIMISEKLHPNAIVEYFELIVDSEPYLFKQFERDQNSNHLFLPFQEKPKNVFQEDLIHWAKNEILKVEQKEYPESYLTYRQGKLDQLKSVLNELNLL